MAKTAVSEIKIRFRQGDPAQIMFFGEIFNLVHDAFEDLLIESHGDWDFWFNNSDWILPLKKAEADYHSPFVPGTTVTVKTHIKEMRQSSFLVQYSFHSSEKCLATAQTLHVAVGKSNHQKINLPASVRKALEVYLHG